MATEIDPVSGFDHISAGAETEQLVRKVTTGIAAIPEKVVDAYYEYIRTTRGEATMDGLRRFAKKHYPGHRKQKSCDDIFGVKISQSGEIADLRLKADLERDAMQRDADEEEALNGGPWRPSGVELEHDRILDMPIGEFRTSPENDRLYKPIESNSQDVEELAKSIQEHGVQEPLIVTADSFILSGHRRYAAALRLGLATVPCRVRHDVSRQRDPDGFLKLLTECNRQRVKRFDEVLREQAITADPEAAYTALTEYRHRRAEIHLDTLDLGERKRRATISAAKEPFLRAVQQIIEDRKDYWPLSDRQIHYALLNAPPLIHASKSRKRSTYRNDKVSYRALVDLLARARVAGIIPFEVIADETRPAVTWDVQPNAGEYIKQQVDDLFKSYWRDPLQSQPNQIELIVEKNTVLPILRPVASEFGLPITSGRGYCSLPPRHAIAQRFKESGKEKLILLIVSDFDPDGETIATSLARSLRDDFGIQRVEGVKVALTAQQVQDFNLPPGLKAKAGCSRRAAFVQQYGEDVYELEALDPATLQDIARKAIEGVLDIKAFNHEVKAEKREAVKLAALAKKVREAMA